MVPRQNTLRLALLACGLAASAASMAQAVKNADARERTKAHSSAAHQDARAAEEDARAARQAAEDAGNQHRAGAVTAEGAAQTEYSAWEASEASRRAARAAQDAKGAANAAGAANSATHGNTAMPVEAVVQSSQAASSASAAGSVAREAATEAAAAAETARMAAGMTPTPPMDTIPPASMTSSAEAQVTVTSSPPDSVVGEYRIDMAAMDRNGDGRLSRAEARSNATLTAEFAAVDNNRDGALDAHELKGWMR